MDHHFLSLRVDVPAITDIMEGENSGYVYGYTG